MKTIIIAATLTLLLCNAAVVAQTGSSTNQPAASGTGGVPQAPVGHRQPKRGDVPSVSDDQSKIDAADRVLDKKIRGICRGC